MIQTEHARTAGDDGRWAFDLRRFADTIRTAEKPVLHLRLQAGGSDVLLGEIQSDPEFSNIKVHCRPMLGYVALHLQFEQKRSFPDRVARLWPLSIPWRAPIPTAIRDGSCDVSFVLPAEDIPPGTYAAEIAVDDPWLTPRRPARGAPSTAEFRVGDEESEREWLDSLPVDSIEAVIAAAYVLGVVRRPLLEEESGEAAALAVEGLSMACEWNITAVQIAHEMEALGHLLMPHPTGVAKGFVLAAGKQALKESHSLIVALYLMPQAAAQTGTTGPVDDASAAEALWNVCSPFGALLDSPHLETPGVTERVQAYTGIPLERVRECPIAPDPGDFLQVIKVPLQQLEDIRKASALVPKRILDLDTQALVHLEWLLADRKHNFSANRWTILYGDLEYSLPPLPEAVVGRFLAGRIPDVFFHAHPTMRFPQLVYAASLHVVTGGTHSRRAASALQELVPTCPRIVARGLVLAALHLHLPPAESLTPTMETDK